jgi:hypothetical protein
MTFRVNLVNGRPPCPECQMNMVAVAGFGLDPEQKTDECLQCGHVEKPAASHALKRRTAA